MSRPNLYDTEAKRFRAKLKLTQTEFAAVLECSRETIQSLEIARLKLSNRLRARMILATTDPEMRETVIKLKVKQYEHQLRAELKGLS